MLSFCISSDTLCLCTGNYITQNPSSMEGLCFTNKPEKHFSAPSKTGYDPMDWEPAEYAEKGDWAPPTNTGTKEKLNTSITLLSKADNALAPRSRDPFLKPRGRLSLAARRRCDPFFQFPASSFKTPKQNVLNFVQERAHAYRELNGTRRSTVNISRIESAPRYFHKY